MRTVRLNRKSQIVNSFALIFAIILCLSARAQYDPLDVLSTRSVSGQFVVVAPRGQASAITVVSTNGDNYVALTPNLAAISCERIKQGLFHQLGLKDDWRGKIYVALHTVDNDDEPVTIDSEKYPDGWTYHLEMPDIVERTRFVRSIVNVLLLEMANRRAAAHTAELPLWLTEGLTQQLLSKDAVDLTPPPATKIMNGVSSTTVIFDAQLKDPMDEARAQLGQNPPLNLQQLMWPADQQSGPDTDLIYRTSAQLFVSRLLQLKDGPASLQSMIYRLPDFFNWQTAFLNAFHSSFSEMRDLEKWWALQTVSFEGRTPAWLWSDRESWRQLDEVVRTPVQVRDAANELPEHGEATLPEVIQDMDPDRQGQALERKLRELEFVKSRAIPEVAMLAEEYHQVLEDYLGHAARAVPGGISARGASSASNGIQEALARLTALDTRRLALSAKSNPATNPIAAK